MRKFIDIRPEERSKVTNLFFQNFFDGLGTSFFYAMGIFIFLGNSSHHEALHYYPLVFLIGGLLILMTSPVYSNIEKRVRTDHLIYGLGFSIVFLIVSSLLLLKYNISFYTGIALLIVYQLIYYLRQTQFWGLSSLSFNVLQSRRLFSIVSAGDLPAKFLGYSLVFKLLESGVIHPENLVYFSVFAYGISFYFLNRVFRSDHHLKHSSHEHFRSGVKEIKFFGTHLIRVMAFMAFFIMFVVFIVDYTFTKVVMHKINEEDVDMYVLVSTVLYSSYGLASILKLFFTGRVFQALGLKWTMVITPILMLVLILSAVFVNFNASDPNYLYVRMFIFLYIGFIVFRDVIGKPVFLTLFQPLSKKMRLHGHNIVKGIAEPLGMIVSGGLLLLYFGYFEEYRLELFAFALLVPIGFWIHSAFIVRKTYNHMLQNIINLRLLSGKRFLLIDQKTTQLLEEKLDSNDEIEVLFALDHLKNYKLEEEKIIRLINHESDLVKKASWELAATTLPIENFVTLLQAYLNNDHSFELRKQVYYILGYQAKSFENMQRFLMIEHPEIVESILLGWSKHKKFDLPPDVYELIDGFLESSDQFQLCVGLRIQKLIQSKNGKAYITKALESKNNLQRKSAVIGSFGFLDPQFFNRIVAFMKEPALKSLVKNELIILGESGLKYYVPLLKDGDDITTIRLIQVLGSFNSDNAFRQLVKLLEYRNPDIRRAVLETIYHYRDTDFLRFQDIFNNQIRNEIQVGNKILPYHENNSAQHLYLHEELEYLIKRVFRLLSFLYDPRLIKRIEDGVFSHNTDHQANSIETLMQVTKPEIHKAFKKLIDDFLHPNKKTKSNRNKNELLEIHNSLNKWTVASILNLYGCENENIRTELLKRNAKIIAEQLKSKKMEDTNMLRLMEKVIMLKKTSLFKTTPENVLVEVAELLDEEQYEKGTTIFNKGEVGDCMYIIYSGKVRIHDKNSTLAVFDQYNFFGDLAMLDTETRSASATAESELLLLRLDQEAIYELMNDRIEVAQGIIKTLCSRIRNLNKKYVEIDKD